MVKSQLIENISAQYPHLYLRDVVKIVDTIFEEISDALVEGNRVELRGFGTFLVRERNPRIARNPKTGERVEVEKKFVPFYKSGKELRQRMNKHHPND